MNKFTGGGVIVLLLTTIIIYGLFHNIVNEANQVSFASAGDGVKSTFGTIYHIKHDTSYWHTNCMNYPWGESVFFTDNQVFLTNTLKFIDSAGLKIGDYALGISNILILFSFVLGAFFLYLIFMELEVPIFIAITGSIMIMLLSPQWDRLGGHYSLAYAYTFPLAIFLLMRFYKKPSFVLSGIMAVFMIFLGGKQFYYLVLIGVMIIFVFIVVFINNDERFGGKVRVSIHFLIQFVLPLLLISLLAAAFDNNTDRTAYPWGFIQSTTRLEGVFLPLYKPYAPDIHVNGPVKLVAYVGLVSSLTMIWIILRSIYYGFFKKQHKWWEITEHTSLNILFWAGFVSLLISLGLPFTLGLENLINYAGPIRQFRAIGRFIFPFYYMINILAVYLIGKMFISKSNILKIVSILAVLWLTYDAWLNVNIRPKKFYNKFEILNDYNNVLPGNKWVNEHDWSEYQAIMPFPYFHIGSENYWIGDCLNQNDAFFASIKTGLPLNSVQLGRTSISETLKNLDLFWEPCHAYPILDEIQQDKPYLFMVSKGLKLTMSEENLISYAELIDENERLIFYKFYPFRLNDVLKDHQNFLKERIEKVLASKDSLFYLNYSFDDGPDGEYSGKLNHKQMFCSGIIPDTGWYKFSIWINDMDKDLMPRTRIKTNLWNNQGNKYLGLDIDIGRRIVYRIGGKALFEDKFYIKEPDTKFELEYYNRVAISGEFRIDDILVRKANEDIVIFRDGKYYLNNR